MFCQQCGKTLPGEAMFCDGCGSKTSNAGGGAYAPSSVPAPSTNQTTSIFPPPADPGSGKVRTGKNTSFAGFLAVLAPGLGHIYMKKVGRGLVFLGIGLLGLYWFIYNGPYFYGYEWYIVFGGPIVLWIAQFVDLYFVLKKY